MKLMLKNFWKLFKTKPKSDTEAENKKKVLDLLSGLLTRMEIAERASAVCMELIGKEITHRQSTTKGLKASLDLFLKHSKELTDIKELLSEHAVCINEHSDVINNNVQVLNTHLTDEHNITLRNDPTLTVQDIMKKMKKNSNSDEGNN